jgi:hypothetical protein
MSFVQFWLNDFLKNKKRIFGSVSSEKLYSCFLICDFLLISGW